MKSESFDLETSMSHEQILQILSSHLEGAEMQPIQDNYNPLATGPKTLTSFVAEKRTMLWPQWTMQVYIYDLGDLRGVELVALGESGLGVAMHGRRDNVPIAKSVEKVKQVLAALR